MWLLCKQMRVGADTFAGGKGVDDLHVLFSEREVQAQVLLRMIRLARSRDDLHTKERSYMFRACMCVSAYKRSSMQQKCMYTTHSYVHNTFLCISLHDILSEEPISGCIEAQ